jgi:Protein of unknown function (DUF3558)
MSPVRGQYLAALLIWLLCGTSACTADQPAVGPAPDPTTLTSYTPSPPPSIPPPITRPLDASAYKAKPCELITAEQVAGYGLEAPLAQHDPGFISCIYSGLPNSRFELIWVRYYYATDWLGEIYRGQTDRWYGDFIPIMIAGQPAAREEKPLRFDQPRNEEQCRAAVGLSETQGLEVSAVTATSSCAQAVAVAEVIVRNLGG